MKNICIVTVLYNEELVVDELMLSLEKATKDIRHNFEYIVVDDGSSDNTLNKLFELKKSIPNLNIIKLSRNWGHQNAFNAGIDNVPNNSDAIILMDGDLEDPPEFIAKLIKKWEEGYEIVHALKKTRIESFTKKILFSIFHYMIRVVSNISIDHQAGIFSLVDKRPFGKLKNFNEKNKFYVGLRYYLGYKQTKIYYDRQKRFAGAPKQSYKKLFHYSLNAFFSFSFLPIRVLTTLGLLIMLFSLVSGLLLITFKITGINIWIFHQVPGWVSLVLLNLFMLSIIITFMGILGEYIARVFDETRQRPYYIVDEIFQSNISSKTDNTNS